MRTLLVFALLAQLVVVPDRRQEDTVRLEKDGMREYTIRRDMLNPNHFRVYDRHGQVGTFKRDFLYPDRYRFKEIRH